MRRAIGLAQPNAVVAVGTVQQPVVEALLTLCTEVEATLHLVDAAPAIDVDAYTKAHGHLRVHQRDSLEALAELGAVDAAILDGDHNWYTVLEELRRLRDAAREAKRPFPVTFVPDIGWPYGRRDVYFDPTAIPAEHRQEHAQKGLVPGNEALLEAGGLNRLNNNAVREGGERNGVLTAVEDFVKESEERLEALTIPGFHGLAVLVPQARLKARPELAKFLGSWNLPPHVRHYLGRLEALRVQERVRNVNLTERAPAAPMRGDADAPLIHGDQQFRQRQQQLEAAAARLRDGIEKDPEDVAAHQELGRILLQLRRPAEAAEPLERAVELLGDSAIAHMQLGGALITVEGRHEDAVHHLKEAARLNPSWVPPRARLAGLLHLRGDLDESQSLAESVIRDDPNVAEAYETLAHTRPLNDDETRQALALADRESTAPEQRQQLHYALATTFDKAKDYERAFFHAQRANDLTRHLSKTRRGVEFDPTQFTALVDALIAVFRPQLFEDKNIRGSESDVPTFIVGMPRSGTTLTEQILASHSRVYGARELNRIAQLAMNLPRKLQTQQPFPQAVHRLTATVAEELADNYLSYLRTFSDDAWRITDKLPRNFLYLGFIRMLYPNAKVFVTRRDPRDVAVSHYFNTLINPIFSYAWDLRHMAHYLNEYERLIRHFWEALPGPMYEVDYARLTADAETVVPEMVQFAGLEWEDACLEFHRTKRVIMTPSSTQVTKPMYTKSRGRWANYEQWLGPLVDNLRLEEFGWADEPASAS